IAPNASAADIQAALEALSNLAPGDISVTGGPLPATVTIEFSESIGDAASLTVPGSTVGGLTQVTTRTGNNDNGTDCVPGNQTLFIPNVTTDVGLSPPFNSLFTIFGQFF